MPPPPPKARRRKPATGASVAGNTPGVLFCSFCGKSQHEVRKLIAGPLTFICDECVTLCVDIVGDETEGHVSLPDGRNQFMIRVTFEPALSDFEIETFPTFVRKVAEAFPDCNVSLRGLSVHSSSATLTVQSPGDQDVHALRREVSVLVTRLRVTQQKLLVEVEAREALEKRVRDYETLIASKAVSDLKERGEWPNSTRKAMLFCFMDVVGFSNLADEVKARTVELLRNVVAMLARSQRADFLNMWGDGIAAGFEDPQQGLECACLFVRHLELYGLNVRVGVAWGIANVRSNSAVGREDVDGACVDLAARLEALAEAGEVVCTEDVAQLDEIDPDHFQFASTERLAKKAFAGVAVGDRLTLHTVTLKKNAAALLERKSVAVSELSTEEPK
ncbi:MAG: hypothetical protein K2P70_09285 [Hyphomonadaceae bacterium]|nr:hypothetical protein [Hyphomonadaceae bacterium]